MNKNGSVYKSVVLKITVTLGAVLAGVASARAEETTPVVWTNVIGVASQWGTPANWTDASGNVLSVAPTNAADNFAVSLVAYGYDDAESQPYKKDKGSKTIETGAWSGADAALYLANGAVDPAIHSITGDVNYVIRHTTKTTYKQQKPRYFTIDDPNGFLGWWTVGDANAWFRLPATETFVPILRRLSAVNRPGVDVPTAGTKARVEIVQKGGLVEKSGAGTLTIGKTGESSASYLVNEGTLELEGVGDGELKALLAKASLHLDASVAQTFTYTNIVEYPGVKFISRWDDVRGNGNHAYFPNYKGNPQYWYTWTLPMFESPEKSPTGLTLVDFGSKAEDKGELGPSNCVMQLDRTYDGISDAFVAEWDPKGGSSVTLLGGRDGLVLDYNHSTYYISWPSYQNEGFTNGEILYNGTFYNWSDSAVQVADKTNLFTLGVSGAPVGRVQLLGTDRYYRSRSNRTRAGEIILFTNCLTRAEQLLVAKYLDAKWRIGDGTLLTGTSAILKDGASLAVSADRTAQLESATAPDGTLVKAGAGTLEVGRLEPSGSSLQLQGGTVRFAETLRSPVTNAPADAAYMWLDETGHVCEEGSDSRVTAWRDRRSEISLQAVARDDLAPTTHLPTILANSAGSLPAVSLGLSSDNAQTYFALPTWEDDAAHAYAGFMVLRPLTAGSGNKNYFGSSDMTMMRNSAYSILSGSYKAADSLSALWRINGMTVDPMARQDAYTQQTNDFFVLAFSSSQPLVMNAIGKDRRNQQAAGSGNIAVGELIVYHRPLTLEEVRDTEAYLMAKWLKKDHPAVVPVEVSNLSFGGDAEQVVDTDKTLAVDIVTSGSGTFYKRGAGEVTVAKFANGTLPGGLAVEEGKLSASLAFDPDAEALFHFDASDLSSLAYTVSDDLSVTNVTVWKDVRGTGLHARSEHDAQTSYKHFAVADPVLVTCETASGVWRPALDFGDKRNTADTTETVTNAAAMRFLNGKNEPVALDTVRETFLIVAQRNNGTGGTTGYNNFLGATGTGASADPAVRALPNDSNYMRSAAVLVNASYCYPGFTNTALNTVFVDGERVVGNKYELKVADGFKMIEFRPGSNTRVGALALDRNCNAGGCCLCEVIGFDHELTEAERTSLRSQLRHKWFGAATPSVALDSVRVASGAELDIGDVTATVNSLRSAGKLVCANVSLAANAVLDVGYRSPTDVDCSVVDGAVMAAGALTVNVRCSCARRDLTAGAWKILGATDGLTLDLANVTLTHDFPEKVLPSLFLKDGALWLRLEKRGLVLIIRRASRFFSFIDTTARVPKR